MDFNPFDTVTENGTQEREVKNEKGRVINQTYRKTRMRAWENSMFTDVRIELNKEDEEFDLHWTEVKIAYLALFKTLRLKIMKNVRKKQDYSPITVPYLGSINFNYRKYRKEMITPFTKMRRPGEKKWVEISKYNTIYLKYKKWRQQRKKRTK